MAVERLYTARRDLPPLASLASAFKMDEVIRGTGVEPWRAEILDDAGTIRADNLREAVGDIGPSEVHSVRLLYTRDEDTDVAAYIFRDEVGTLEVQTPDPNLTNAVLNSVDRLLGGESPHENRGRDQGTSAPTLPPDHPSRLNEAISSAEYGSIESLIAALQQLLDTVENLREEDRNRIQGAIDVLAGSHRVADADVTSRAEMLATIKAVVRFVAVNVPTSIVLWNQALGVLSQWYPSVAQMVRGLVS